MSIQSWQEAFLGMGAVLGEPLERSLGMLDAAGPRHAQELLRAMRSPSRTTRARAIARAMAAVVVDIDRMQLA
jgi:hypothetical protein